MLLGEQRVEPVVEYRTVQIATELLCESEENKRNPTVGQLVRTIVRCVEYREPIKLFYVQPIQESPETAACFAHHCLDTKTSFKKPQMYLVDEMTSRWSRLRSLVTKPYPLNLTLMFDDIGFLGRLACLEWCRGEDLHCLKQELRNSFSRTKEAARRFFGKSISVKRWSEFYSSEDFYTQYQHARDFSRWKQGDTSSVIESTLEMQINAGEFLTGRDSGKFPSPQVHAVILQKLARIAADCRLKANVMQNLNAIGIWSGDEQPNSLWPIILSNYDGSGYAPAIAMRSPY